jgi:hypothetical protein
VPDPPQIAGQLIADRRNLLGRGVQHVMAQRRITGREEPDDRRQDEQQGEDRDEG